MSPVETLRKHGDASDTPAGSALGARITRIDGPAKIRGAARYPLEFKPENMAHAVLVGATVAAGRVSAIDASVTEAAPGVVLVLTRANTTPLQAASDWLGNRPPEGTPFSPFPESISFAGQPVAAVVAETFEQATEAARLLRVDYERAPVVGELTNPAATPAMEAPHSAKGWGDAKAALDAAPIRIEREYLTQREYQAPMEPHGSIAAWEGNKLTIWTPSQWLDGMARTFAEWFGIPFEDVCIVSPYLGGGFGSKGFSYPQDAIAPIAAKMLGRPVKLPLTRPQTFELVGGRAATRQKIALGATREGKLLSLVQDGASETSIEGLWVEPIAAATTLLYDIPNLSTRQDVVRVNSVMPGAKRAPGKAPSAFGIECAIDELAHELGIDPLEMRLLNYAEQDPEAKKPWSTRQLREGFHLAADAFGWSRRSAQPRSMRDGHQLVGWGIGVGTFPVIRAASEAKVEIRPNGVGVSSSTVDMGQGAYTILAQTAAEVFGLSGSEVTVTLGDSRLARAGVAGGSRMANAMVAAVHKAAMAARDELVELAIGHPGSPFRELQANTLTVAGGRIASPLGDGRDMSIGAFLEAIGRDRVEATRDTLAEHGLKPEQAYANYTTVATGVPPTAGDFSMHSWCVHFVEVKVDEDFGTVRASRVVSAFDCGRLYNPRLVESQWKGGIIMGLGQALLEEAVIDPRNARMMNANFGDYLVPTNADVPDIQVISVGIPDLQASPLGGKGVGEVGIVGVAPAVANAVFHATGKRVRELPVTLEKLI